MRDEALKGDFARLDAYFPPDERRHRSITDKWKEITNTLDMAELSLFSGVPKWPNTCACQPATNRWTFGESTAVSHNRATADS